MLGLGLRLCEGWDDTQRAWSMMMGDGGGVGIWMNGRQGSLVAYVLTEPGTAKCVQPHQMQPDVMAE